MKNQNEIHELTLCEYNWKLKKEDSSIEEGSFIVDECIEFIEKKNTKLNRHAPLYDMDEEDDSY